MRISDWSSDVCSSDLSAALIILPGTKATIADLEFLRAQGWDIDIAAHVRRGGHVLGICGGYQMLGRTIADPDGIEGAAATVSGLGYLPVETVLGTERSEERRVGKECVSTCRSRWSPYP